MPYNAGGPTAGSSFGAIGPRISANIASAQQGEEELLRKFYTSLLSQQGSPFQAATVPKPGVFLNPDVPLTGIDSPGGGQIPAGGSMSVTPSFTGSQQYVKNPTVNELLNSWLKPGGGKGGGGAGKLAAALGAF